MRIRKTVSLVCFGLVVSPFGGAVLAQSLDKENRPEVVERVFQCRIVEEAAERLACFDRETALMEEAEQSDNLIIADKEQVQEARRGLFGLKVPKLKLFGGGDDKDEISEIETTVASARRNGLGKMILVLEDGARWIQTGSASVSADPDKGDSVTIRSGSLGSYFAKVNGGRPFRVKRIN